MIEGLIKKIASGLDKIKVPYMIIGGQAVLLYGTPRLTRDIDITLGVDTDKLSLIKKLCKELHLKILIEKADNFVQETKVLPAEDVTSKIRIDFIFSFSFYERQALKRTRRISMLGYPVRFASCEDVIIHKMFSGRAIDEEDVRNIIIKNRGRIDLKYIKKYLLVFDRLLGRKGLFSRFKQLCKR
jgi:predicted nucleotidyltransferase